MNKKLSGIVAVTTILVASGNAYAFPKMATIRDFNKKPVMQQQTTSTQCENFNGSWLGNCTFAGNTTPIEEFQVTQLGCDVIIAGGEQIFIGGMQTINEAFPIGSGSRSTTLVTTTNWNADKSVLNAKSTSLSKELQSDSVAEETIVAEMKKVGSQLAINASMYDEKISCIYDKQQSMLCVVIMCGRA